MNTVSLRHNEGDLRHMFNKKFNALFSFLL